MTSAATFLPLAPPVLSGVILAITLVLFVSERVRHDLVAVLALLASVAVGLVDPRTALTGFADPAVIAVAAVLIVGRALELSGIAGAITARLMPRRASYPVRMAILLTAGAVLSAFMNNIAALVITMPIATEIARSANRPPGTILMPLAFATILGGMTTLIGTPANLIISSIRERELGEGFGMFTMTPVGALVTIVGIAYIAAVGWRLLPRRQQADQARRRPPWMTFELAVPAATPVDRVALAALLRPLRARMLGVIRGDRLVNWPADGLQAADRLLLVSRTDPWRVAAATGLAEPMAAHSPGMPLARVSVAHGSPLIGRGYAAIGGLGGGAATFIAAGPRAASERRPLNAIAIRAGDQLFLEGHSPDLARIASQMRLLEIDRYDRQVVDARRAGTIVTIFLAAIAAVVAGGAGPAISFMAAAAAIAALRLMPAREIYGAIDWSIIVLLAAMIPVGASFESSGAAAIVADWLGDVLRGAPLVLVIAAMGTMTMLLSIFLNNVATALVMAPLGIRLAEVLGVPADAMLLAVLIGASSDFLTPIGHQNNLLVMAPGGYRFGDYIRMGALVAVLVISGSALFLARQYG